VERVDGVFLWVRIAVASLLRSLRGRNSIHSLQRRLCSLPRGLEPLYQHIFEYIGPMHKELASQIFQIARVAREHRDSCGPGPVSNDHLTLLALFLAVTPNIDRDTVRKYDIHQIPSMCEDVEAQMTERCAGLLETFGSSLVGGKNIQYLHRTARDFLEDTKLRNQLLEYTTGSNFNPSKSMLKSCVLKLNSLHVGK
jgi:hypothetical protein